MLIIHVYIKGRSGAVERTYDFVHNDGKDSFEGKDIIIPFNEENEYPMTEKDAMAIISNQNMGRDN